MDRERERKLCLAKKIKLFFSFLFSFAYKEILLFISPPPEKNNHHHTLSLPQNPPTPFLPLGTPQHPPPSTSIPPPPPHFSGQGGGGGLPIHITDFSRARGEYITEKKKGVEMRDGR